MLQSHSLSSAPTPTSEIPDLWRPGVEGLNDILKDLSLSKILISEVVSPTRLPRVGLGFKSFIKSFILKHRPQLVSV